MTELVKVEVKNGEQLVSARELHEFLEVGSKFNDWFKRMCEYGFIENEDFVAITQKKVTAQGNESEFTDYILKITMAKEISMLQRNEKGKQARMYFIECEKKVNSITIDSYMIEDKVERAKKWIEEEETRKQLKLEVKAKEEVIVKVTEQVKTKTKMIDDMTKDMDTPLLCKTITDYINILTHRKNETHAQLYTKIYDVLGRRLSQDIIYGKNKYLTAQRQIVNDNIAYNKLHELKGEDRKYPFRMMDARTKLSTLEYIVDVLGEGYLLMETIAKLSEVGIEDIIEKYNYFKTNNINELM